MIAMCSSQPLGAGPLPLPEKNAASTALFFRPSVRLAAFGPPERNLPRS